MTAGPSTPAPPRFAPSDSADTHRPSRKETVFRPTSGQKSTVHTLSAAQHGIAAAHSKRPLAMFSELVSTKQIH
jgi:hypothetical protein